VDYKKEKLPTRWMSEILEIKNSTLHSAYVTLNVFVQSLIKNSSRVFPPLVI
jgi:hypothetical protein